MAIYCFLWCFIIRTPHNFFSQAIKHPPPARAHFIDGETEVQRAYWALQVYLASKLWSEA